MVSAPIVVDLDGTLIHTDMLYESGLTLLRKQPVSALIAGFQLGRGKAAFKQWIADRTQGFNYAALPYNAELLAWLATQKQAGRKLVLCTASDRQIAQGVADHLGIFDEVLSSDGKNNLAGERKAQALVDRYGAKGFDYAGNATPDLKVWPHANQAIVVNAKDGLGKQVKASHSNVAIISPAQKLGMKDGLKVLRAHQWLKNLLLLIPVFTAHLLGDMSVWQNLLFGFVAFCLCASAVYILNDLLDLESDRLHPRKRQRPFASGRVPIALGIAAIPVLLASSLAMALNVNMLFLDCLLVYFTLTSAYSWWLKRWMLIDCLTLSGLYTLRILAGAAAASLTPSVWLLGFSVFLFLSLAFVKRYAELAAMPPGGAGEKAHGRGYYQSDASMVQMFGVTSGYAAVVVLSLYFNSDTVQRLYSKPEFTWAAVPVVLFWVSWMWMQAHRGKMHDDPIVFAIKDKISLLAGAVFIAVLSVGASGLWQ